MKVRTNNGSPAPKALKPLDAGTLSWAIATVRLPSAINLEDEYLRLGIFEGDNHETFFLFLTSGLTFAANASIVLGR